MKNLYVGEQKMQKCWKCGKDGAEHRNIGERGILNDLVPFSESMQRCYCEDCFKTVTKEMRHDLNEYVRLKKKLMFERAVRILERQKLNIYDYQEAIQTIEEFARENPDKFDSAYEMVAAIILIDNEIPCELQHKIGKYQCDFFIPTLKLVLEIDGERHKNRKSYDSIRDMEIKNALGAGWEIMRIKTEYLDEKADLLVEAIRTILRKRKTNK